MRAVIITAVGGQDKPGIIAALSKVVYEVGGNIDDATMTRLRGAFANMIAATLPDRSSEQTMRSLLDSVATEFGLHVTVDDIPGAADDPQPDHVIKVYGADHSGIVHRITSVLANHGANITDLDTRVAGTAQSPIYVMVLETTGGDWSKLPADLAAAADELKVNVQHSEIEAEAL